ncbi:MAG TPA: tetratricopeptide repeat protein, partial [Longimicrobiales bacterium]|nr:tetratricopeptide repeat protein [Longimicrobiales bacterium]
MVPEVSEGTTAGLFTWRNAIMGGVGAGALLAVTVGVYFFMWTMGIGPVGSLVAQGVLEARDPIILAQFENRTDDEMLAAVVTDALRVDLLESQVVTLVDGRLVGEVLQRMGRPANTPLTADVAREVAEREGIKAVVEGEVSRVGSGYLLAARVVVPGDGQTLAAFRENAASEDDILSAIDRLSQRLREKAGESLRDIRAGEALEAVTTSSMEALRLFAQARQAEEDGDVARTVGLLEEALALDSTFAMAWRKLAVQHSNRGGNRDAQYRAATAAYQHRDRLTQRERYLAEAYYHYTVTKDEEATAQAYRRVLENYPQDPAALNNLGLYYGDRREWAEAAALYQRAIDGPGRSRSAYNNLVIALYNQG